MKCHDDTKESFVKRNDLREKKLNNSSDSETHSLKRKSSRQNQPDAVDETKDDTEMCQDSSEVL